MRQACSPGPNGQQPSRLKSLRLNKLATRIWATPIINTGWRHSKRWSWLKTDPTLDQLLKRKTAWERAAERAPHGEPILLPEDEQGWSGSDTVSLRAASAEDAARLREIYTPYVETTAISFETEVPTVAKMAERIERFSQAYPYLVAERDGRVVGYAYGSQHRARASYRFSCDVTIYVDPTVHRSGLGRVLYGALLPDLAARGYHAAFSGITLPNAASVGLHETMGFTKVGIYREVGFKFDRWHDVGWWQKILAPPSG